MLKEHGWEKLLGEDPLTRTANLARAAREYREVTDAASAYSVDRAAIALHAKQLQRFGQNLQDIKWAPPPKPKPK